MNIISPGCLVFRIATDDFPYSTIAIISHASDPTH